MSDEEMLCADDIPWALTPLPRLELLPAADLIALDFGELLEYAYSLQRDLGAVRSVLQEAVGTIARVSQQRDRALDDNRRLGSAAPRTSRAHD